MGEVCSCNKIEPHQGGLTLETKSIYKIDGSWIDGDREGEGARFVHVTKLNHTKED